MAVGYRIAEGYLEIVADHAKADRQIAQFFRGADGKLRDMRGRFASEGELAGLEYGKRLEEGMDRKSQLGFGGLAKRFGTRFLSLGKLAGGIFANGFVLKAVAGLAALPGAVAVTGALVHGLAQMGGAVAALAPATIGGAIFSLLSLKVALSGFGDALKAGLSGDTEKFAEALKKLGPGAQEAAKAFVSLAPAARELKKVVQSSFFAPWMKDIVPLGKIYLPIVRHEMAMLAGWAGLAVHQIGELFRPPDAASTFQTMLANFVEAFRNIAEGIPGLISGFFNLADAGSAVLSRLTQGFGNLTDGFSAWTAEFVDSGRFDAFVTHGLGLIGQFTDALADVVGIVRKVFAAVPGGGGLLAALAQVTDGLNRFLETAQGQQALSGFFARLQTLAGLIMDLVKGALPGLLAVSDGLLKGFQALAPVAGPVGEAIGQALAALAPILPLLGNLLAPLLRLASILLQGLAAELGPVIKLFSDMASQALPLLLPMLDELASQVLPLAADAGRQIAEAFAPIIPVWIEMVRLVGGELMKYLPAFVEVSKSMIPTFVEVGKILADTWLVAFEQIRPHIPFLIQLFAALVLTVAQLLSWYVKLLPVFITFLSWFIKAGAWVAGFVLSIRRLPGAIADAAAAVWNWVKGAGAAIGGFFVMLGGWFAALPGKIWTFLQQIPAMVRTALSQAFDAFFFWLGYITATVIQFVVNLPNRLRGMLASILTTLSSAITAVGQWFSELPIRAAMFFSQLWSTVTEWVLKTYQSITNWLGQVPGRVGAFFADAWYRARSSTISGVNSVIDYVRGLPDRILNALSGAARWLYGVGSDIVHGLVNGFNSALDWAMGMIERAMNKLKEGAKAALHIGSPSRVFADEVGRWIPPGIAQGIEKGMPALERYIGGRFGTLATSAAPQVNVSAPNVAVGGPRIAVYLDGKEIAAGIQLDPKRVAATVAEGDRRRNFLNTGRGAA